MLTQGRFESGLAAVAAASTMDELSRVLYGLCRLYGLANLVYHAIHLPPFSTENPILLLTYDEEWVRLYKQRDYFRIDPVVSGGIRGFLPLDWGDVDHSSLPARRFFSEADKFGVGRQGITMPIRGPAGERALFTATSNATDADWREQRVSYLRDFQTLGHFVHDRAVALGNFHAGVPTRPLSRRELECLQALAQGWVVKQVADRLGLADVSVRLYLRSARHKLQAPNTAHAIATATALELIKPRFHPAQP